MSGRVLLCQECEIELDSKDLPALCRDCASKTPGEAKACPSCGCPLVGRVAVGAFGEWEWRILPFHSVLTKVLGTGLDVPIAWCPEHGCDLEAEFHLKRKAQKIKERYTDA